MSRSKSSQRWLKEHFSDAYVKQAQQQGYRSRAAFKLIELQKRDNIIKPAMTVIDLGAAPGGWSQLLSQWVGIQGKVIALDILPMQGINGVEFIQGDFREPEIFEQLVYVLQDRQAHVIVSDMAPNTSGQASIDQPRAMYLTELSLTLARQVLVKNGTLVVKAFQGSGYEEFLRMLRQQFKQVVIRKPDASRARSRENYLVAKGYYGIVKD